MLVEDRAKRGLELFRTRGHEIEPLGKGRYSVPGCSERAYEVDVDECDKRGRESCTCPDYVYKLADLPEPVVCKHIVAAAMYRAKRKIASRRKYVRRDAAEIMRTLEALERFTVA